MVTSFAAIVNLPRGFANADRSHPVALLSAVTCCVGCWALRRWASATQRVSWLLRPATLRLLALVLVFGIAVFVNWQAERDLRAGWYTPGISQH
jgi:hypothetical protein